MVHTLCSTPRADNTCKDTNFFLNIRKREAEKFAMAGFLVRRTRIGMQVGARGPDLHGVREGRGVAVRLLVKDGCLATRRRWRRSPSSGAASGRSAGSSTSPAQGSSGSTAAGRGSIWRGRQFSRRRPRRCTWPAGARSGA